VLTFSLPSGEGRERLRRRSSVRKGGPRARHGRLLAAAIIVAAAALAGCGSAAISTFPGVSQFTVPYGDIAAAAVVVTIPVMILVLVFQRRIVAGLTAGAVKG
jgi:ABC-type glycerol-3-phosphate transport system permease component